MFIPAYLFKTDKLTDLSYSISFAVVAIITLLLHPITPLKIVLLAMIVLWSLRIGGYLFIRIRNIKKDKRFDGIRENFFKFLGFWTLQGFTVWVVLIPSILFFSVEERNFNTLTAIGGILWFAGLLIETISDYQKYTFINDSNNKDTWIDSGLWKYSRHPNYFGEILHWLGIYIFTTSDLSGWLLLLGFVSPVYIATLIIFVSGIPKLEQYADNRWGNNPRYIEYKKRTSILLLLPQKSL